MHRYLGGGKMGKVYNDITETIGKTPLVRINSIATGTNANILAKLEYFNPLSSVKDRIGFAMIDQAEKKGQLKNDSVIIEPTSGNTGIGLAFVCAAKGYKLILTMPDTMSVERRKLLKALGAEIVLTPGEKGMKGAIDKAIKLGEKTQNSFIPQQFENLDNPRIHRETTAIEIWDDTNGEVDIFIAGIGTGGTVTGVGEALKDKNPAVKIIGLEPEDSAILSGEKPGLHKIQGMGAGFVPKILNLNILDEIIKVKEDDAGNTARMLAKQEGIFTGISGGAAMWAALEVAKRSGCKGKTIVVILPDTGERYLSTWLWN